MDLLRVSRGTKIIIPERRLAGDGFIFAFKNSLTKEKPASYNSSLNHAHPIIICAYMHTYIRMAGITSIRISTDMRDQLSALKTHPKESYEEVISRLVECAVDDEPLSDATIKAIEESLADIKAGRVRSLEEVAEELGLCE